MFLMSEEQSPKKFRIPLIVKLIFVVVLLTGASGVSVYAVLQRPDIFGLETIDAQRQESESALVRLKQILALPDEEPTVANVTNEDALKNQKFFSNVKNGDVVFIYNNAKKVVLFRPSENKIIDVGTLDVNPTPVLQEEVDRATEPVEASEAAILDTSTPVPSASPEAPLDASSGAILE